MYSYNSSHKIVVAFLIIAWAIFQFGSRNEESLRYENGQAKRIGNQKNSLNHGTWIWYFSNGEVQLKGDFIEGERNGEWKRYDSLGNLVSESFYTNNKLEGLFTEYDAHGEIVFQHIYHHDTLIKKLID